MYVPLTRKTADIENLKKIMFVDNNVFICLRGHEENVISGSSCHIINLDLLE